METSDVVYLQQFRESRNGTTIPEKCQVLETTWRWQVRMERTGAFKLQLRFRKRASTSGNLPGKIEKIIRYEKRHKRGHLSLFTRRQLSFDGSISDGERGRKKFEQWNLLLPVPVSLASDCDVMTGEKWTKRVSINPPLLNLKEGELLFGFIYFEWEKA